MADDNARKLFDEVRKRLDARVQNLESHIEAVKQDIERDKHEPTLRRSFEQTAYDSSKAWLEFARNFLVVCVLSYAASKSGKWYLALFAWVTQFALIAFTFSYFYKYIDWFARPGSQRWVRAFFFLLFIVAGLGFIALIGLINTAIEEVVAKQGR